MGYVHLFLAFLAVSCVSAYPKDKYDTEIHMNEFMAHPKQMTTEEMGADMIPSHLPYGIHLSERSQKVALAKLAKIILKPIIMSKELNAYTKYLEKSMMMVKHDPSVMDYIRQSIDGVQQLYERTDGKVVTNMLTWLIAQYSDEATARSVTSFWRDLSPAFEAYFIRPFRHYFNRHVTPRINFMRHRIDNMLGEDISSNVIARSGRWSDMVEPYIDRLTAVAVSVRQMVEATAQFLEQQDAARMAQ